MSNKMSELKECIKKFCDTEYRWINEEKMGVNSFTLYAVDCGGYDTSGEVKLHFDGSSFKLIFYELHSDGSSFKLIFYDRDKKTAEFNNPQEYELLLKEGD